MTDAARIGANALLQQLAELPQDDWPLVLDFVAQLKQRREALRAQARATVAALSDEELLALMNKRMELAQDRRFSLLLDRQQAGTLTEAERDELAALMRAYQEGLLRQAQAMREAVQRGLRAPLAE